MLPEEEYHRQQFNELVKAKLEKASKNVRNTSSSVSKDLAKQIIHAIDSIAKGESVDKNIKQRIKKRNFIVINKKGKKVLGTIINGEQIEIALYEDYFKIIKAVHDVSHGGLHAVNDELQQERAFLPREYIGFYIQTCPTCNLTQKQVNILIKIF